VISSGQVAGEAFDLGVGLLGAQAGEGLVHRALAAAVEDDPRAFSGEPGGDGEADALGGARDQGAFVGQVEVHVASVG